MFLITDFFNWKRMEYLWLLAAVATIGITTAMTDSSTFSMVTGIFGILCVVLTAKGKLSNFVFGLLNVGAYGWLSFQNHLYGDFALNIFFYIPFQFIGFFLWKKMSEKRYSGKKSVRRLTLVQVLLMAIISGLVIFGYGKYLSTTNDPTPYIDSTSTVLSIVATVLMSFRYAEQWLCWIIVNIVTIIMWVVAISKGSTDYAMVAMWSIYLINAFFGWYNWTRKNVNC